MGGVTTKSKEVKAQSKAGAPLDKKTVKKKSPSIDEYGLEVPQSNQLTPSSQKKEKTNQVKPAKESCIDSLLNSKSKDSKTDPQK